MASSPHTDTYVCFGPCAPSTPCLRSYAPALSTCDQNESACGLAVTNVLASAPAKHTAWHGALTTEQKSLAPLATSCTATSGPASAPTETSAALSAEKASALTPTVWKPWSVLVTLQPASAFQMTILGRAPTSPVAHRLPSALAARHATASTCAVTNDCFGLPSPSAAGGCQSTPSDALASATPPSLTYCTAPRPTDGPPTP